MKPTSSTIKEKHLNSQKYIFQFLKDKIFPQRK